MKEHVKKQNARLIYAFARTFYTANLDIIYIYVKYTTSWSICWKINQIHQELTELLTFYYFDRNYPSFHYIWNVKLAHAYYKYTCSRLWRKNNFKMVSWKNTWRKTKWLTYLRELSTQQTSYNICYKVNYVRTYGHIL